MTKASETLINIHLKEYLSMREELRSWNSQKATVVNFSLIAIGALISFLPPYLNTVGYQILLVAALPFYGLAWYLISIDAWVSRITVYLRVVVVPKINSLIEKSRVKTAILQEARQVLEWESLLYENTEGKPKGFFSLQIQGGRNVLIIGPVIFLLGLFFLETEIVHPRHLSNIEQILLWSDLILAILLGAFGIRVKRNYGLDRFSDII